MTQDGICPSCGGWCLLTDDATIAPHAGGTGPCPGAGHLPAPDGVLGPELPTSRFVNSKLGRSVADSRIPSGTWLRGVLLGSCAVVGIWLLTSNDERVPAQDLLHPTTQNVAPGAPASTATLSATSAPQTTTDDSLGQKLAEAGVEEADIRELGAMAYETHYVGTLEYPSLEDMSSFAYIAVLLCRDVAVGESTWEDEVDKDTNSGATLGQAERMTGYLQDQFCPGVR